jgi:hypothetical protein
MRQVKEGKYLMRRNDRRPDPIRVVMMTKKRMKIAQRFITINGQVCMCSFEDDINFAYHIEYVIGSSYKGKHLEVVNTFTDLNYGSAPELGDMKRFGSGHDGALEEVKRLDELFDIKPGDSLHHSIQYRVFETPVYSVGRDYYEFEQHEFFIDNHDGIAERYEELIKNGKGDDAYDIAFERQIIKNHNNFNTFEECMNFVKTKL